jgi:hypothetical protein
MAVFTGIRLAAMFVLPLFVSDVVTPDVPPAEVELLLAEDGPDVELTPDTLPPALVLVLVALALPPLPPVAVLLPPFPPAAVLVAVLLAVVLPTLPPVAAVFPTDAVAPTPTLLLRVCPWPCVWPWPLLFVFAFDGPLFNAAVMAARH